MLRFIVGKRAVTRVSPRLCRGLFPDASITSGANPRQSRGLTSGPVRFELQKRGAFTLVEMLVAMAITLVMMGAVVTLFANISHSVRNRRATIEMTSQIRHVRNVLQQDLQGATCPGVTWQQSESNHGYIQLIEGIYREGNASILVDGDPITQPPNPPTIPPTPLNPEIDHMTSILPSSNLPFKDARWATDGGGLGDYDDILMLTVRNEHEPFVGRIPRLPVGPNPPNFSGWEFEAIHSTLAEVVWFAIENPGYTDNYVTDPTANRFFGEPGMRTIYRRTLLIAPWVNPYKATDTDGDGIVQSQGFNFKVVPGLVRMLPDTIKQQDLDKVMASVVAFQDRYDLSVRAEWDPDIQHWKIVANTLGDLTKRENRFGHFGFFKGTGANSFSRVFPYPMVSFGSGYSGSKQRVEFVDDPEMGAPASKAQADANLQGVDKLVVTYSVTNTGTDYKARPFAYVDDTPKPTPTLPGSPATVQAMLNDKGEIVRLVHGPVPLSGTRRGEDVMMTDVLAFDMRVYDPGAPMFATRKIPGSSTLDLDVVLTPTDPGWLIAYMHSDNMGSAGNGSIGNNTQISSIVYPYIGQGAYVDMGYGFDPRWTSKPTLPDPKYAASFSTSAPPWFFRARGLSDVYGQLLAPGYSVYDTWSFHYENNGVNEDNDELELKSMSMILQWQIDDSNGQGTPQIDEGTNGLDDHGHYFNSANGKTDLTVIRLGVDDTCERETTPPYDKPLRGMQVLIRTYERDARAMRQVRVNQHFMQE